MKDLNLLEIEFPSVINVEVDLMIKASSIDNNKERVSIALVINKITEDNFSIKGSINLDCKDYCSSCLKTINLPLSLEVSVTVLEKNLEFKNESNFEEIHYQDLSCFSIEDLVQEEIQLSYPNGIFCEDQKCKEKHLSAIKKESPFKKLKDLL
jgi:uncharacterized metal-binding protein YceD (DUF177 family)|tara:strand:+ start:4797 stop:5255 length:459 start_codon:yes stop_codon:yes gene_type:complete